MTDDEICEERMRSLRFSPDPHAVWAHAEITRLSNELTRTQAEHNGARRGWFDNAIWLRGEMARLTNELARTQGERDEARSAWTATRERAEVFLGVLEARDTTPTPTGGVA